MLTYNEKIEVIDKIVMGEGLDKIVKLYNYINDNVDNVRIDDEGTPWATDKKIMGGMHYLSDYIINDEYMGEDIREYLLRTLEEQEEWEDLDVDDLTAYVYELLNALSEVIEC